MESWPAVCESLDKAITTVARNEYRRLSAGRTRSECLNSVGAALEALGGLQRGEEPQYNEWEALFYMTWYQPRQVNLALALILFFFSRRTTPVRDLHIIDLGCGALAVRFAVAIAIAEKRLLGSQIDATIQGIDPSRCMTKIGEELWLEFWSTVNDDPHLSHLTNTCDDMTSSCAAHDSCDSYYASNQVHLKGTSLPTDCWLIAAHTVYESNTQRIRNALETIRNASGPALVVLTTNFGKILLAHSAAGPGFALTTFFQPLPWSGTLSETTAWRRDLIDRLKPPPGHVAFNFLTSPVEWNPPSQAAVIYREGD